MSFTYNFAARRFQGQAAPSGTKNFISYERLVEQLRRSGEFRAGEVVTHLEIGTTGITYRVESPAP